jgi:hypothetical protein
VQFRAFAYDINSADLITELPVRGLEFENRLNDAGAYKSVLPLTGGQGDVDKGATILGLGGTPFKVVVTDEAQQRAFYSGACWGTDRTSETLDLTLTGKGLTSYFTQVSNWKNYNTSVTPTQLIQNVVNDVQARNGANRGLLTRLAIAQQPAAITPNYLSANHTTPGQIISDMTAGLVPGTGGVDYYVEDAIDPTTRVPRHTLVIAAPRAGRSSATSQLSLVLSAAQKWTWPTDATQSGNHVVALGSTAGVGSAPSAEAWGQVPIGAKGQMPLLEQVIQFSQVTSKAHLQALANGLMQLLQKPASAPTVTLPVDYEPMPLGSFMVGDEVHVTTEPEPRFPQGLDEWWRIVAYKVTAGEDGNYSYTLTLNRPVTF